MEENQFWHTEKDACGANELIGIMMQIGIALTGKGGEAGMKCFPLDCTTECPHFKTWDLSIDDWTSVCDILKVQVDDCDGDYIRYRCPLDSDKRYQNALQERR